MSDSTGPEIKNFNITGNYSETNGLDPPPTNAGPKYRNRKDYWIKRAKACFLKPFPRKELTKEQFKTVCAQYIYDTQTYGIAPTLPGFSLYIGRDCRRYETLYPEIFNLFEDAIISIKASMAITKEWQYSSVINDLVNQHGYFSTFPAKSEFIDLEDDDKDPVEVIFLDEIEAKEITKKKA